MIVTFTQILDRYEEDVESKNGIPKSRYVGQKGKVVHICSVGSKRDWRLYDVQFKDGTIWSLEPEQVRIGGIL